MSNLSEFLKSHRTAANFANFANKDLSISAISKISSDATANSDSWDDAGDGLLAPSSNEQEVAREQVLAELRTHTSVQRTFCTRFENGNLIIMLAIRGVGTGELFIPAKRFNSKTLDDFRALLECFESQRDAGAS